MRTSKANLANLSNEPRVLKPDQYPLANLPNIPPPILTDFESSDDQHNQADAQLTNIMHQALYAAWSSPNLTINTALRLITKSLDFVKHRRKLYGLPYDANADMSSQRRHRVIPID